jgi:hypothetical protein
MRPAFALLVSAVGLLGAGGCISDHSYEGSMKSQSGETVFVQRDQVFSPFFGSYKTSEPYYYESGAKVYVNEGAGSGAPSRPTEWKNDQ